jgi:hypothetical protein
MRLSKIVICGVLAAVTMAILASAAMAEGTSLCKVKEDPCAAGDQVFWVHLVSGTVVVETSLMTVLCLSALAVIGNGGFGETLVSGGFPIHYVTQEFTFSNCGTNATHDNCSMKNLSTIGLVDLKKTAANLGSAEALRAEFLVSCTVMGIPVDCVFGSNMGPIAVEGAGHTGFSGNGMFTFSKVPVPKLGGGILCPEKASLTALFEPLEKIYVSS